MYYFVFIIIVIVLLYISNYITSLKLKKHKKTEITKQFGKTPNFKFYKRGVEQILLELPNDVDIDDVSWRDLDMDQVFIRLNNCQSFVGEQILYKKLHFLNDKQEVFDDQEILIEELSADPDKRLSIQWLLHTLGKREESYNLPQFIKNISDYTIPNIWLYLSLSILFFTMLLLAIFVNRSFTFPLITVAMINIVVYLRHRQRFGVHICMLSTFLNTASVAHMLIHKYRISQSRTEGINQHRLKELSKVMRRITFLEQRAATAMSGNIGQLLLDYIIGCTLWDILVAYRVVKLIARHSGNFDDIYHFVGEVDSAISIMSFRQSLPHYCRATFGDDKAFKMLTIYHPLIEKSIYNDVDAYSHHMITGSNASGKSTFIKAVAINIIFAQTINTVLATQATMPFTNVITSMAVRDNITTGESYYIKEVSYLKRMIDKIDDKKFSLCFIDEILRGTNTEERIAASVAILNYLKMKNCLIFVATHDLEVTALIGNDFINCHFSEVMSNDDIYFDYKVKPGISKTKNAIKLLEIKGFPSEVVKNAKKVVEALNH